MAINFLKKLHTIREDPELQLHLLIHFEKVGEDYREYLASELETGHALIEERLLASGSIFHTDFAEDPLELLEGLLFGLEQYPYEFTRDERVPDLMLFFPEEDYPQGIGMDGILGIDELDEKTKSTIELITRSDFEVGVIKGEKKPTWQLNVIFQEEENGEIGVRTVFPGKYAPPLPDKDNQSDEEYNASRNFWDNHVFLI